MLIRQEARLYLLFILILLSVILIPEPGSVRQLCPLFAVMKLAWGNSLSTNLLHHCCNLGMMQKFPSLRSESTGAPFQDVPTLLPDFGSTVAFPWRSSRVLSYLSAFHVLFHLPKTLLCSNGLIQQPLTYLPKPRSTIIFSINLSGDSYQSSLLFSLSTLSLLFSHS